ncbi:hypothetical protein [Amycolatopsis sp. NPDC059657]|uniref:hypothetical protein n=1 Tax=Amycolatopsis sp. NPDC059657 TaxID=3346899 RepID=UPI00366DE579
MTDSTGAVHAPATDIADAARLIHAALTSATHLNKPDGVVFGVHVIDDDTIYVLVGGLPAEFVLGEPSPIGMRIATIDRPNCAPAAKNLWMQIERAVWDAAPRTSSGRPLFDVATRLVVEQFWAGPRYVRDGVHLDGQANPA